MRTNLSLSLFFVFFFVSDLTLTRGLKKCESHEQCVRVPKCQPVLQLLRTNSKESIDQYRNSICKYERRRALVCCSGTLTPKMSPITQPTSLLPSRCGEPLIDDKIVGGAPAPLGAYPWMVPFGYVRKRGKRDTKYRCAGSLINSRYVLTAAHCVEPAAQLDYKLTFVNLGDWDLSKDIDCTMKDDKQICNAKHITAGIESVTIHPDYNKRAISSDDIALIRLNISIDFKSVGAKVGPVCLADSTFNVEKLREEEVPAVAAGWGVTETNPSSDILLRVTVPFADNETCLKKYPSQFLTDQICVGGKGRHDTCSGDSGGPLVVTKGHGPPFYQVGIVSYGKFPCGINKIPGVYTSVSFYRKWIIDNLKP